LMICIDDSSGDDDAILCQEKGTVVEIICQGLKAQHMQFL